MYSYDRSSARRRDYRQDVLELLKRGPKSIWTLTPDHLDAAEKLLKDGFIEEAGTGRDGRPLYQLTKRRSAAKLDDLERPAQDVVNMSRDLYRLVGRIESAARRMKSVHPQLAAEVMSQLQEIDRRARRLSMDVDEGLGL